MSICFLTANEGARAAGVHPKTVLREAARGKLRMIRFGGTGRALFRADEIETWAASRTRKPYGRPRGAALDRQVSA